MPVLYPRGDICGVCSPTSERLMTIPAVGPITAPTVSESRKPANQMSWLLPLPPWDGWFIRRASARCRTTRAAAAMPGVRPNSTRTDFASFANLSETERSCFAFADDNECLRASSRSARCQKFLGQYESDRQTGERRAACMSRFVPS
jgi:hypothetical protein